MTALVNCMKCARVCQVGKNLLHLRRLRSQNVLQTKIEPGFLLKEGGTPEQPELQWKATGFSYAILLLENGRLNLVQIQEIRDIAWKFLPRGPIITNFRVFKLACFGLECIATLSTWWSLKVSLLRPSAQIILDPSGCLKPKDSIKIAWRYILAIWTGVTAVHIQRLGKRIIA